MNADAAAGSRSLSLGWAAASLVLLALASGCSASPTESSDAASYDLASYTDVCTRSPKAQAYILRYASRALSERLTKCEQVTASVLAEAHAYYVETADPFSIGEANGQPALELSSDDVLKKGDFADLTISRINLRLSSPTWDPVGVFAKEACKSEVRSCAVGIRASSRVTLGREVTSSLLANISELTIAGDVKLPGLEATEPLRGEAGVTLKLGGGFEDWGPVARWLAKTNMPDDSDGVYLEGDLGGSTIDIGDLAPVLKPKTHLREVSLARGVWTGECAGCTWPKLVMKTPTLRTTFSAQRFESFWIQDFKKLPEGLLSGSEVEEKIWISGPPSRPKVSADTFTDVKTGGFELLRATLAPGAIRKVRSSNVWLHDVALRGRGSQPYIANLLPNGAPPARRDLDLDLDSTTTAPLLENAELNGLSIVASEDAALPTGVALALKWITIDGPRRVADHLLSSIPALEHVRLENDAVHATQYPSDTLQSVWLLLPKGTVSPPAGALNAVGATPGIAVRFDYSAADTDLANLSELCAQPSRRSFLHTSFSVDKPLCR